MDGNGRYEFLEKIGAGSYATVYRARDNELGREVAVKQIHQQFLDDPHQLDRYWQEAQLLASLQHPNIITIFDIDRERGWLIMELMQATVAQRTEGRAMDLRSVRTTVAHGLRALQYLHSRGIIHGDLKPANLMIDARRRVKIGDFGLSRRVSDDDGSLLKGTAKYMAPEVVSDEFGEVGPASDLYSLGFTAYELMCGPNFESLFPGLSAFGRDKQVAWMMWQAAPDRRLPEIDRVLEGVPSDLAHVVQKLVEKDPAKRYQSAEHALSDLRVDLKIVKTGPSEGEQPEQPADSAAKQKRILAVSAFVLSAILSLAILFVGGETQQSKHETQPQTVQGIVGEVLLTENVLIIAQGPERIPKEIKLTPNHRILLNEREYILLRNLEPGDHVTIRQTEDDEGRPRHEIAASRADLSRGYVKDLQAHLGNFMLVIDEGAKRDELLVTTAGETEITVNGRPGKLGDLKADDRVEVHHIADAGHPGARAALRIAAFQRKQVEGVIREVDAGKGQLTIETAGDDAGRMLVLPLAETVNITVNGQQVIDGRLARAADLQPGDRATVFHDSHVSEVRAVRQFQFSGVVQEVRGETGSILVGTSAADRRLFVVSSEGRISINDQPAELADLRRNDRVELSYDRSAAGSEVTSIDAVRPARENRWAIVVGVTRYDDAGMASLDYAVPNAQRLHDTLLTRYACPPEQTLLLTDETRVRIEQALTDWLKRPGSSGDVVVYFVGHGYLDEQGKPYLAAKDFSRARPAESGLPLEWLRDLLDECPAERKLLLLDACHPPADGQSERPPSTAALLEALPPVQSQAVFRSTSAIAGSQSAPEGRNARGRPAPVRFGDVLIRAYAGAADKNRDVHLEPTELFDYLKLELAEQDAAGSQTPVLFLPDDSPAPPQRLSDEAQQAVRDLLAANWGRSDVTAAVQSAFATALSLAEAEPDARLAFALLQFKTRDRRAAIPNFERVKFDRPDLLLPYEALAWMHFEDSRYEPGFEHLIELCTRLTARTKAADELDDEARRLFHLAGLLREFAVSAAEPIRRPTDATVNKLDRLIAGQSSEVQTLYQQGRDDVQQTLKKFDEQIRQETTARSKLLELQRKRLNEYARFDFEAARRTILDGLDKKN